MEIGRLAKKISKSGRGKREGKGQGWMWLKYDTYKYENQKPRTVQCELNPGKPVCLFSKFQLSWHVFKAFTNKTLGNNSYLGKNIILCLGEGGHSVKHLPCKPRGPEFNAQKPDKNGMCSVLCACNPSTGEVDTQEDPWGSLASQASLLVCSKSKRDPSQGRLTVFLNMTP